MYLAITLFLILVSALVLVGLRLFRPNFTYAWPIAVMGALLIWISTFLWQINFPTALTLYSFNHNNGFGYTISLTADGTNYPYALGIVSIMLAVIFVSAMKAREANPLGWVAMFFLSAVGLLAVLSGNLFTLITAWALLDISGLVSAQNAGDDPTLNVKSVLAFSSRVIGTGIILWATILGFSGHELTTVHQSIGTLVVLGIMVRLSALIIPIPYSKDPAIRNEYEVFFKLITISSTIVLLSRLNMNENPALSEIFLILLIGLVGYFSVVKSIRERNDSSSRIAWTLGLAALAISSTLLGNPIGSTAWGSAILFSGGLLFLYKAQNRIITIGLLISVYILSSLPYSLTASGWMDNFSSSPALQIYLIPSLGLLIASYIQSMLRSERESLDNYPRWVKVFYPMGLAILAFTGFALGITGWDGAGQWNTWIPALVAIIIAVILSIILLRIPEPSPDRLQVKGEPAVWINTIQSIFIGLFNATRRLLDLLTNIFEGDGGILWTILFLVIFISLLGLYAF